MRALRSGWPARLVAALTFVGCAPAPAEQEEAADVVVRAPLEGAWQLIEVTTTGPDDGTTYDLQPALYLFTDGHYSITRVTSVTPRPEFRDPANVTPSEALAVWGPLQSQAGTFQIIGENLYLLPTTAKNPQVMRSGRAPDVYTHQVQGDGLVMTQVSGSSGLMENPATFTLLRVSRSP